MNEDALPNADHVARYCKPSEVDHGTDKPKVGAFQRKVDASSKKKEDYLSVNWLEYFDTPDRRSAVECVRRAFRTKNYSVRGNGRFVTFNVAAAKSAALAVSGSELFFTHLPCDDDPSHSGIFGYPDDDLEIATELKVLITDEDVFQAVA